MAYLNKEQYAYRAESAAKRNAENEAIAVENGMSEKDAELVSELCSVRHEFHCSLDGFAKGDDNSMLMNRIRDIEGRIDHSELPSLNIVSFLEDIDDMDGLIYEYGDDVPEDHDSDEFHEWYDDNYQRIYGELSDINNEIEQYLIDIDKKYKTSFAPTGALRIY